MPALHIVLVAPEIPWNTGNVGRSALAAGAQLHLVRPLGFKLDHRHVKRAGLDYWQHVDPILWPSFNAFDQELAELGEPWLFSAEGEREIWDADFTAPTVLIFGSETSGLPPAVRRRYSDRLLRIPMAPGPVRSLNVATSAAIALFEAQRQRLHPSSAGA